MVRVFSRPGYATFAAVVALASFLAIALIDVLPLIFSIATDVGISVAETFALAYQLIRGVFLDTTKQFMFYAVVTSLLIGINTALLLFYFRMFRAAPGGAAAASGVLGGAAALLGFGCAACGSVFLISFIATLGGGGLLALLPYGGEELGYLGLALLALSSFFLTRAINKPPVCPI